MIDAPSAIDAVQLKELQYWFKLKNKENVENQLFYKKLECHSYDIKYYICSL
jgi:hypothetical protein